MSVLDQIAAAADPALAEHATNALAPERFAGVELDPTRRFVLEAVYEGHLLHHGTPRLFAAMDEDLRLLGGDALYALGLARLATLGDIPAVSELAALISAAAQAQAEDRGAEAERLWDVSAGTLAC